jgi:transcription factor STE12
MDYHNPFYQQHFYQQQPLHVLTTDHSQPHDDDDPTAHPSRPHTYHFHADSADYGDILPNCVGFNRPLNHHEQDRIAHLDRLKFFLATAPSRWDPDADTTHDDSLLATPTDASMPPAHPSSSHPALNRFLLPTSEYVSCVLWNSLYHITGTDIVRALVFRFEAFGRPVRNMKKFEEGIFSDLRNLKPGVDACLEEPKVVLFPICSAFLLFIYLLQSPFLDLLFKYQCIRTQKKQKVFYWQVPQFFGG